MGHHHSHPPTMSPTTASVLSLVDRESLTEKFLKAFKSKNSSNHHLKALICDNALITLKDLCSELQLLIVQSKAHLADVYALPLLGNLKIPEKDRPVKQLEWFYEKCWQCREETNESHDSVHIVSFFRFTYRALWRLEDDDAIENILCAGLSKNERCVFLLKSVQSAWFVMWRLFFGLSCESIPQRLRCDGPCDVLTTIASIVSDVPRSSWSLLFSRTHHGFSLQRMSDVCVGYDRMAFVVIRTLCGMQLGFNVGNLTAFLRSNGNYSNSTSTSVGGDAPPCPLHFIASNSMFIPSKLGSLCAGNYVTCRLDKGILVGGREVRPRLFIDADLTYGTSVESCSTYVEGAFAPGTFTVQELEVWGLGGVEACRRHTEYMARMKKFVEKERVIDRSGLADDADRYILTMAGAM
eukprot:PhF_6_TR40956/c0_g1_i1/m.61987